MATNRITSRSGARRRILVLCASALLLAAGAPNAISAGSSAALRAAKSPRPAAVRIWPFQYTAHNGAARNAYLVLPSWYGPRNNPAIPVIISPHGRNANGLSNTRYFGNLPGKGRFAVISPDGMGRRLGLKSYAFEGQIDDLARMPQLAAKTLPWLRLDLERVYALGSSMGGQETLMLAARHPGLLAGAAAMDSVTNLSRRYRQLPDLSCDAACMKRWGKPYGLVLQKAMRDEVGGMPATSPERYQARSAASWAKTIAASGVPLQIWWSSRDLVVSDQKHQSWALFRELKRLNRCAPISAYAGRWPHSREMKSTELLPIALHELGLLRRGKELPRSVRHQPVPACAVDPR
jgi:poly(3-hydroxybutyrate) depolymerase